MSPPPRRSVDPISPLSYPHFPASPKKSRAAYVNSDTLPDPFSRLTSSLCTPSEGNDNITTVENSALTDHNSSQPGAKFPPLVSPISPQTPTTGELRSRRVFAPAFDSNNAIVGQRTRTWGRRSPLVPSSPSPEEVADADEGSWPDPTPAELAEQAEKAEKDDSLRRWVEMVPPVSPEQEPTEGETAEGEEADLPSRPDSARPIPPAHVALVSDEESSDSSEPLPTPRPESEKAIQSSTQSPAHDGDGDAHDEADDGASPWASEEIDPAIIDVTSPPSRSDSSRGRGQARGSSRGRAPHAPLNGYTHGRPDWRKPQPHPVFSPKFSDRRLFIHFPVPLREDLVRPAITQHFSRYGTDPESVERCLADPRCGQFSFQSNARVARTELDIKLERRHPLAMTRTIFVQITGSRIEARPRSASPLRRGKPNNHVASIASSRATEKAPFTQQPLPHQITVFAKPALMRGSNKLRHFPTVLEQHVPWSVVSRKLAAETGREPEVIAEVDTSPRVPERDIIPRLCDMLAEIVDVIPPTMPGGGWLIRVAGPHDCRRIFEELAKIPGIYTRWHHPGDGKLEASPAEAMAPLPMLPLGRPEHEVQAPAMRSMDSSHFVSPAMTVGPAPPMTHSLPSSGSPAPSVGDRSLHSEAALPPFLHPILRREIVYMYKDGRQVEREEQGTSVVFLDKRAIHVSRLVKEKETKATLLERFKHYGSIAHIEYNPASVHNTYATARILYHERDAAVRARDGEDGKVSFGSAMKVVERIVQDRDVELVCHVYLDPYNNIISPAAAEQYSPPRPAETLFPQQVMPPLPPPVTPTGTYTQPPQAVPPYLSHPASGLQPAPGYMMMPLYYGMPMAPPTPYQSSSVPFPVPNAPPHMPHMPLLPFPPSHPPNPAPAVDSAVNDIIPGIQALGVYGPAPVWVPYHPYYPVAPAPYVQHGPTPQQRGALSPPPSPLNTTSVYASVPHDDNPAVEHPAQLPLPTPPLASDDQAESRPVPASLRPSPSAQNDQSTSGPRVTKFEWHQGEFKPVYDPDDLKAWYESRGMQLPEDVTGSNGGQKRKEVRVKLPGDRSSQRDGMVSEGSSDGDEKVKTGESKPGLVPVPVPFSPRPTRAETEEFVNIYPRVHPIPPLDTRQFYIRSPKPTDKDDLERIKQRRARELATQTYAAPLTLQSPVERAVLLPGSLSDAHRPIQRKTSWRKKVPRLDEVSGAVQVDKEWSRVPLQPSVEVHREQEEVQAKAEGVEEEPNSGGW